MYVICNNCLLSEKDAKPAMVCSTNELSVWKDFPKGLRVLLLDEDSNAAAELKLELEAMDYIVSTFYNETEALSAFSGKPEDFHVAIVEVSTNNIAGSFKFLETAKDLPTIMTSNIHCLSTMMKGIALGAVEFLQKPLSEDKLRNIWQHVVHKAFSAGGSALSDSLKPVKQYSLPMLHLKLENGESKNDIEKSENVTPPQQSDNEQSEASDRYPAPLTPQLQQGGRLLDEVDCQDNIDSSTEKETEKQDEELKFVETTCDTSIAEGTLQEDKPQEPRKTVVKQEHESPNGNKTMCSLPRPFEKQNLKDSNCGIESPSKASGLQNSRGNKAKQKKMKVDWTPELHKKFVHAVEQLGVDQAIPSRVLELMQVEGLTRHNVASHLQKYRMHKRHILPKEGDRRWPHSTDQMPRNYYFHKPIMAFPPYHSNHLVPTGSVYPTWGAPSNQPTAVQMWGLPGYTPWQQADSWNWKPYPEMHADAWGCPMMPPPHGPYSFYPQSVAGFHNSGAANHMYSLRQNSIDLHPVEEVIDKVVKDAISKPWLPLPLGLKPPSSDSVLAELSRQGISNVPSHINCSNPC